jgi:hypothetical protein
VINEHGMALISPRRTDYARLTSGLPERIGDRWEAAPEPRAQG